MKEKYVRPETSVIRIEPEAVISASSYKSVDIIEETPVCDSGCAIWHMCRDRNFGNFCCDKKRSSIW